MRGASSALISCGTLSDTVFRSGLSALPAQVQCMIAECWRTQAVYRAASFSKNKTTHVVHSVKFEFQVNNNFLSLHVPCSIWDIWTLTFSFIAYLKFKSSPGLDITFNHGSVLWLRCCVTLGRFLNSQCFLKNRWDTETDISYTWNINSIYFYIY